MRREPPLQVSPTCRLVFHCRGAAYVEFAIVLPILLLFVAAIFELARIQNELVWLNQAAHQVAMAGATTIKTVGDKKIRETFEKVKESHQTAATIEMVRPPTHYRREASGGTVVSVELRASIPTFFTQPFGAAISTSAKSVVPYLYISETYRPDDVLPENPDTLFNCAGGQAGSSSNDCRTGICACSGGVCRCRNATTPPLIPSP